MLLVFNMSATMARQGGRVQLEQSDMHLALNIAKIAKGGFLRTAQEKTQQLIKKPCAEVREGRKRGVEFPRHQQKKAVIERHLAMIYKNHKDGCLPCQNGTAKNLQTCWRRKGTGVSPPEAAAHTPGTPPPPGTPPAPPGDTDGHESYEIEGKPSMYVYIHSPLPNTHFVNHNVYVKDSKHKKHFIPNLLIILSAAWKYYLH